MGEQGGCQPDFGKVQKKVVYLKWGAPKGTSI